jgi:hypothetical protein
VADRLIIYGSVETPTGELGAGFPPKSILYRLIVRVDIEASNDDR